MGCARERPRQRQPNNKERLVMAKISFSSSSAELTSLWDDRKMAKAWDFIILYIQKKSNDPEFARVATDFLEENKPSYKRKRSERPSIKKEKKRPPYGPIKPDTVEIGERFDELKNLTDSERYKRLLKDFPHYSSINTIKSRLRDYDAMKKRDADEASQQ